MLIFAVDEDSVGPGPTSRTSRPQAVSSAFVTAGQPTSGDHRCGEGGEEGSGPCSMEFGGVRGVAHLARESEDLERVAVWSVAFDRLGAVVAPTDGGSQDPHPGGGLFCRQRAWGEVVGRVEPGWIDEGQAVHGW